MRDEPQKIPAPENLLELLQVVEKINTLGKSTPYLELGVEILLENPSIDNDANVIYGFDIFGHTPMSSNRTLLPGENPRYLHFRNGKSDLDKLESFILKCQGQGYQFREETSSAFVLNTREGPLLEASTTEVTLFPSPWWFNKVHWNQYAKSVEELVGDFEKYVSVP